MVPFILEKYCFVFCLGFVFNCSDLVAYLNYFKKNTNISFNGVF